MRYIIILFFCFLCFSCNQKKMHSPTKYLGDKSVVHYDSIKFNHKLIPDTSGYNWIIEKRAILDTINFVKAVVVVMSDTFLSLPKYKRLWSCPLPLNIMVPNDTILISGFVYEVLPSNGGKGYPTLITQLVYSDKK
ncbi:MAG: hypothetical protein JWQ09_5679 [Segetibacter sp.]|nr:hypothetical protein [Segetibacter sp.]